ncbi:MAG: helix-turn-helix domain-containing protein [Phycisphaera sp.]|nr:helix-turn-helix domain-containing protein [Phycisphaera sp.]
MGKEPTDITIQQAPTLAIRPAQAARVLGIGRRLLWSLTNQGIIPSFKLGKARLYSVESLREFMADRQIGGGK